MESDGWYHGPFSVFLRDLARSRTDDSLYVRPNLCPVERLLIRSHWPWDCGGNCRSLVGAGMGPSKGRIELVVLRRLALGRKTSRERRGRSVDRVIVLAVLGLDNHV
jgi:hypothetical protein